MDVEWCTYRKQIFRAALRDAMLLFYHIGHVVDSIVKLGRVVINIGHMYDNRGRVGKLVVKYSVSQVVFLQK